MPAIGAPVAAVFVADAHLSLRPPPAREGERDWLETQARAWRSVAALAGGAPVVCAGDVFDRPDPPLELVNWALGALPPMLAVPGNHDLPSHRADLAHRSAFGTLVRAGKVRELGAEPALVRGVAIYGRPFGEPVPRPRRDDGARYRVLVTHEFIWVEGAGHPGAPEDRRLRRLAQEFRGYDLVVSGDNHEPFQGMAGEAEVWNVGGLMRLRRSDADRRPRVVAVTTAGTARPVLLPTAEERFQGAREDLRGAAGVAPEPRGDAAVRDLVEAVRKTEPSALDYRDNVMARLRATGAREGVRRIIMEALGG